MKNKTGYDTEKTNQNVSIRQDLESKFSSVHRIDYAIKHAFTEMAIAASLASMLEGPTREMRNQFDKSSTVNKTHRKESLTN